MTYQNRLINRIIERAGDIGATVEIEYSDYGTALIDVTWRGSSTSADLFVIIGKRGGVRHGQYSDLLDMFYVFDKNTKDKWMRIWDFFKTVERQKKLTLTLEDKLNAHRGAAA